MSSRKIFSTLIIILGGFGLYYTATFILNDSKEGLVIGCIISLVVAVGTFFIRRDKIAVS